MDMSPSRNDALQQEAADWFARLRGEADAETHAAFARWRDADPAHAAAYAQIEALWRDPDLTAALFAGPVKIATPRARWLHRAAAAAILLLGVGALLQFSGAGETLLADVQPETARPFTVAAGETTAQALGTVYAVARDDRGAAVSVRAGEVLVTAPGQAGQVLQAGQGVMAGRVQPQSLAPADFAWAENRLVFTDRPLGAVLAELNRYWPGMIWVRDADLAALPVSGSYRLDDPPAVVAALAAATGATAASYAGRLLILTR
ncbi:MAG: DUF4880 domain-containing protein [Alphaproteobacteria bacterium]|nr:DUF4880 domain-containing protein [Alphaproteobacteria bacterium]